MINLESNDGHTVMGICPGMTAKEAEQTLSKNAELVSNEDGLFEYRTNNGNMLYYNADNGKIFNIGYGTYSISTD